MTPAKETLREVEAIRERLSKATPWPWKPCERGAENPVIKGPGSFTEKGTETNLFMAFWPAHQPFDTPAAEDLTYNNVELAAHAPADIAFLLKLADRLAAAEKALEDLETLTHTTKDVFIRSLNRRIVVALDAAKSRAEAGESKP